MIIKYLKHSEIDKSKWDECVENSANSLIYGFSYFLDIMAPSWEAIVVNDYELVLPLPVKRKWGIKYFYIPPFTSQLGLFGINPSSINIDFILHLLKKYVKYGDLFFNYANVIDSDLVICRTNFVLSLKAGYETIQESYAANLKRILRKNVKNDMVYSRQSNIEFTVQLYQNNYGYRTPHLSSNDYQKFLHVCNLLCSKYKCFTRSMCARDGSVLCSLICLFDNKRIYTIINPSTEIGRKKESAVFLIDELIKEFSGKDIVLDFVGSDLPGVKFFLNKFSPVNEPCFFYHYNKLPYPLRYLKS